MLCPKCGWTNPQGSSRCANCQAALQQPSQPVPIVPDYLVWSIIVTAVSGVLGARCCISLIATAFGIVAIVKSSNASTRKAAGDFQGALQEAESAKTWIFWSVGVWVVSVVVMIVAIILYFLGVSMLMSNMHRF